MIVKRFVFTVLLSALILLPLSSHAHPGRTDSKGGHYDRSTGEYHYHHGYPAHQHLNGICPYNLDDKTGQNSGSRSISFSRVTPTIAPRTPNEAEGTGLNVAGIAVAGVGGAALYGIVVKLISSKRNG